MFTSECTDIRLDTCTYVCTGMYIGMFQEICFSSAQSCIQDYGQSHTFEYMVYVHIFLCSLECPKTCLIRCVTVCPKICVMVWFDSMFKGFFNVKVMFKGMLNIKDTLRGMVNTEGMLNGVVHSMFNIMLATAMPPARAVGRWCSSCGRCIQCYVYFLIFDFSVCSTIRSCSTVCLAVCFDVMFTGMLNGVVVVQIFSRIPKGVLNDMCNSMCANMFNNINKNNNQHV